MKKVLSILLLIVVILASSLAFFHVKDNNQTINSKKMYFTIKSGDNFRSISSKLQEKGIIKSEKYFLLYARFNRFNTVMPGKYIISPNMNFKELFQKFKSGKSDYEVITVPEGYTLYQIATRLEKHNLGNIDSIISTKLKDLDYSGVAKSANGVYYELEGYLFPDTYYIPVGMYKNKILEKMLNRFDQVFTDEYVRKAKEMGMSVNEVITVASLIEKEAANDSEKPRIAGVIYNRLQKKMPLQIDASIIYAITKGERHLKKVYYKDLKFPSKYNIYINKGLPSGPIASPGKASIDAALYPEKNDYLYYVLGKSGHVFSKNYSEHVQNINKYFKSKQ